MTQFQTSWKNYLKKFFGKKCKNAVMVVLLVVPSILSAQNHAPVLIKTAIYAGSGTEDNSRIPRPLHSTWVLSSSSDYTDDDGNLCGIAIYGQTGDGQWLTVPHGSWVALDSLLPNNTPLSETNALLLYRNAFAFIPNPDFYGTATLLYRAWDQTTGMQDSFAVVSVNGGATAFSADTGVISFIIKPVNDAPEIMMPNTGIVATKDIATSIDSLLFFDLDGDSAIVEVSFAVNNGTLNTDTISGVVGNGTNNLSITNTVAQLNAMLIAGGLVYKPDNGFLGVDMLHVAIDDLGNISVNSSPSYTANDSIQINVAEIVNTAPVMTDASISVSEDASVALLDEITTNNPNTFADADDDDPQMVRFESMPTQGTIFQDGGYPAVVNTEYSLAQFSLMYYAPAANYNGTDSFELNGSDGAEWAATAAVISITVNAVNDAPVLEDIAIVTNEETSAMIADFTTATTFTDADGDAIEAMKIVSLPTNGILTLYSDTLLAGDLVYAYELEHLYYVPAPNFAGSDSFTFNATDGADYAAANGTANITVNPINDGPTAVVSSTTSVDENLVVGTSVATLTAMDVDAGDSHIYQLISGNGDAGNAFFSISGNQLLVASAINYELNAQLSIRVQTVDLGGLTYEEVIVLDVNDQNDAPTAIALSNNTIDEQQPAGSFVGVLATSDEDAGDSHTLALVSGAGDADNASFTIVNNVLTTATALDYNTQQLYTIRVRSTDTANASVEEVFTINVTDINQAPATVAISNATIAENGVVGSFVGYFTATDADANDVHTFSLVSGQGDDDNASFTIANGDLTSAEVFDFETKASYTIRVSATDLAGATTEAVFVITIADAPDSPTGITISATSINENETIGTLVGSLTTLDPDQTGGHTYGLVGGTGSADNGSFNLVSGGVYTNFSFNYEVKNSYSIRVRSTDADGGYIEEVFSISVNDMNDAPTDVTINTIGTNENSPIGATVANITAIDEDLSDLHSFTLVPGFGAADNGKFTIQANKLQVNANLDYETQSSYAVRVRATDTGGAFVEKYYTVNISDVNEAPTGLSLSATAINENEAAGATIGTLSIADQDHGDSHSFGLVSGAGDTDNGAFTISGNTLIANASFNFEVKNSYSIRIAGTDLGGLKEEGVFTITINNVADAPMVANIAKVVYKNQLSAFTPREFSYAFSQEEGNTQKHIRIAALPANGQLFFSNTPVVAGQIILVAEFNNLAYMPASNFLGMDQFTFAAFDGVMYSTDATYTLSVEGSRTVGSGISGITAGSIIKLTRTATGAGVAREGEPTGIEDMPLEVAVFSNYPNPFQGTTNIRFELSGQMTVTLEVYDLLGRKVASLVDGEALNGKQVVQWNGGEANGQYIARLSAVATNGTVITKTINLVQVK